jgi:hypothetical protein
MALSTVERVWRKLRELHIGCYSSYAFDASHNSKANMVYIIDLKYHRKVSKMESSFWLPDDILKYILASTSFDIDLYRTLAYNRMDVKSSFIVSLEYD